MVNKEMVMENYFVKSVGTLNVHMKNTSKKTILCMSIPSLDAGRLQQRPLKQKPPFSPAIVKPLI